MIIQCPECQARYRIKTNDRPLAAVNVTCPKCGVRFAIANGADKARSQATVPNILVVDDARFFRELISDLLADRQAHILMAESARQAWDALQRNKVDLLIVDVNLPDLNGFNLIEKIRADAKLREIKILCISGVHRKEIDKLKAIEAGADDFTSKSFNPAEFHARIDNLLNDKLS